MPRPRDFIARKRVDINRSFDTTQTLPPASDVGIAKNVSLSKNQQGNPLIQCKGNIISSLVTTEASIILPYNDKRVSFFIQNLGIQDIYLSFDGPTSSTDNYSGAIFMPPQGYIELKNPVPTNEIYGVAVSGSNLVTVIEGSFL